MLRKKHVKGTTLGHSIQKQTTKKVKMSALVALALLIPALATVALVFTLMSISPTKSAFDLQREVQSVIEEDKPVKKLAPDTSQKNRDVLVEQRQPQPEHTSDNVEYHILFSTGCSIFQDWQSYTFFYHAMVSNQPGTVTRIVSGCSEKEEGTLTKLFEDQIASMAPGRFRIHFTPDYSRQKRAITYKYWNKPFGTKHWMEHALGFPDNPQNENAIVVLLDPDQIILRPYRNNDFSNTQWSFLKKGQEPRTRIEHGKPMGQKYAFGIQWKRKIDMSLVLPNEKSPVDELSDEEARVGFIVGPPYIATARDMYAIVTKWCEFALPVHDQYPHLLAEMFAYCLAAAHLRLAHQTAASFMVSDAGMGPMSEGWGYIDKLPKSYLCRSDDPELLPNVLHFCQRYAIGNYFFGKYRLPKKFVSCEHPLFAEPPPNFLEASEYQAIDPGTGTFKSVKKKEAKQHAFMVCRMILALNSAAEYFKHTHCNGKGNFNKTFFH